MFTKNARNTQGFAVWVLLVLFTAIGCGPSQKTIREDGESIFQDVYVPSDAVILSQYQQDSVVVAVYNCKGIEISVIYGTNRPANEVLNEYIEDLFANGWHVDSWNDNPKELPHFYKGFAFVGVYFAIPPDVLAKFTPDQILQTEGYTTVYLVDFSYAVPSSGDSEIDCHA